MCRIYADKAMYKTTTHYNCCADFPFYVHCTDYNKTILINMTYHFSCGSLTLKHNYFNNKKSKQQRWIQKKH